MSVLIFFGMAGIIILIGIATIVSTLLQWKRNPRPEAGLEAKAASKSETEF